MKTSVVVRVKLVATVAAVTEAAVAVAAVAMETALAAVTAGTGWQNLVALVQRARAPHPKRLKATFIARCENCEDIDHDKRNCSSEEAVLAFEGMRSNEELAVEAGAF